MKYLTILAGLLIGTAAQAQINDCQALGLLAEKVMESRQNGVSPADMIEGIRSSTSIDERAKEPTVKLILFAYQEPRYMTDEAKRNAIQDFRALMETACYQNGQGG